MSSTNQTIQEIIDRVTEANYKYYNDSGFSNNQVIDCMIIHICRKHASALALDSEYYWNDYPELLVTDISDIDTEEVLDGTYSVDEIMNLVSICKDCLTKTKKTEIEQKMEIALSKRYEWLHKFKHSSECTSD